MINFDPFFSKFLQYQSVDTELYCPGHVALPALREDPGVAPDDRGQQGDLRRVRVHHLDLVRLDAQNEVSSLGRCHRIHAEPELYNGKLNIYLLVEKRLKLSLSILAGPVFLE